MGIGRLQAAARLGSRQAAQLKLDLYERSIQQSRKSPGLVDLSFLQWTQQPDQAVLFTTYAKLTAETVPLPLRLRRVYGRDGGLLLDQPFTVDYAIFNDWFPVNCLSNGIKHLCVCTFPGGVPALFQELPELDAYFRLKTSPAFFLSDT